MDRGEGQVFGKWLATRLVPDRLSDSATTMAEKLKKQYICVAKGCAINFLHGDPGTELKAGRNNPFGWCATHNAERLERLKQKENNDGANPSVSPAA